jgi:hypothetical protein
MNVLKKDFSKKFSNVEYNMEIIGRSRNIYFLDNRFIHNDF